MHVAPVRHLARHVGVTVVYSCVPCVTVFVRYKPHLRLWTCTSDCYLYLSVIPLGWGGPPFWRVTWNKMRHPTSVIIQAKNGSLLGHTKQICDFLEYENYICRIEPAVIGICPTRPPSRVTLSRRDGTKVRMRSGAGRSLANEGHVSSKGLGDTAVERHSSRNRQYWRSG